MKRHTYKCHRLGCDRTTDASTHLGWRHQTPKHAASDGVVDRRLVTACLAILLLTLSGCSTSVPTASLTAQGSPQREPGGIPAWLPQGRGGGATSSAAAVPGCVNCGARNDSTGQTAGLDGRLSTCLYEAEQLNHLGTPAQKKLVTLLYLNIRAAQRYEPMAGKLDAGTNNTIGPLYQFAINDACNAVSQGLLTVLKKQVPVAGGDRG